MEPFPHSCKHLTFKTCQDVFQSPKRSYVRTTPNWLLNLEMALSARLGSRLLIMRTCWSLPATSVLALPKAGGWFDWVAFNALVCIFLLCSLLATNQHSVCHLFSEHRIKQSGLPPGPRSRVHLVLLPPLIGILAAKHNETTQMHQFDKVSVTTVTLLSQRPCC